MIHRTADRIRHEKLEQLLSLQGTVLRNRKHILREGQPSGVMDIEERSLDAEEQRVGFTLLELTSQTVHAAPRRSVPRLPGKARHRRGRGGQGPLSVHRAMKAGPWRP
jgi:hypothetical protein